MEFNGVPKWCMKICAMNCDRTNSQFVKHSWSHDSPGSVSFLRFFVYLFGFFSRKCDKRLSFEGKQFNKPCESIIATLRTQINWQRELYFWHLYARIAHQWARHHRWAAWVYCGILAHVNKSLWHATPFDFCDNAFERSHSVTYFIERACATWWTCQHVWPVWVQITSSNTCCWSTCVTRCPPLPQLGRQKVMRLRLLSAGHSNVGFWVFHVRLGTTPHRLVNKVKCTRWCRKFHEISKRCDTLILFLDVGHFQFCSGAILIFIQDSESWDAHGCGVVHSREVAF